MPRGLTLSKIHPNQDQDPGFGQDGGEAVEKSIHVRLAPVRCGA